MKPSDLQSTLSVAFRNRLKFLIKGAPGIGKTDIVMAAAQAAEADLVLMHPAVSDPTDFKGLPALVTHESENAWEQSITLAEFLPYGQLRKLIHAQRNTICFIDDIGQAPHAVQAALMQLLQSREIDGQKISDHVVFCGATNDTTHMAGVHTLLEPVKSRWHTIIELDPDPTDWLRWAVANNLPESVIAFVAMRGLQAIHDFKATRELTNSVCPRTVANAAALVAAGLTRIDVLAGAVGHGWASTFIGFLKVYRTMPDPQECIANPTTAPLPKPEDLSTTFAIAIALSLRSTKNNIGNVMKYLGRLPKEHEVLAVRDAITRDNQLQDTPAFTGWTIENLQAMI